MTVRPAHSTNPSARSATRSFSACRSVLRRSSWSRWPLLLSSCSLKVCRLSRATRPNSMATPVSSRTSVRWSLARFTFRALRSCWPRRLRLLWPSTSATTLREKSQRHSATSLTYSQRSRAWSTGCGASSCSLRCYRGVCSRGCVTTSAFFRSSDPMSPLRSRDDRHSRSVSCWRSWCCRSSPPSLAKSSCRHLAFTRKPRSPSGRRAGRSSAKRLYRTGDPV